MEKQRRRDVRGIVGKIAAVVFAAGFVLSIVPAIRALAEGTIFKIQSAEITEISTGATGNINTYDEQTIVSNVTFHKINDSISYKIVLQNSDSKDHIIESITDDNASESINYIYDAHAGETVAAGADLDFLLTVKYANGVTDTSKRAEVSNVKFFVKFTDVEEPEEIDIVVPDTNEEETPETPENPETPEVPVEPNTDEDIPAVPDTGKNTAESNGASINLATMIISVIGLTILAIIAVKKHKKYAKIIGVAVVAVSAFGLATTAKAANVETNSFTLTTNYGLYDKLVIKNGDDNVIINYGDKLEDAGEITNPTKPGYIFSGWQDEDGNDIDPTNPIYEDLIIKPKFTAISYKVHFNANGGAGEMADQTFTYDEAANLAANTFTYAGRAYAGWDTEANGSGVHYDDAQSVKNLTTVDNGVVNLYAQWSINPYYINYNANGGEGEMATTNCEYDEDCQLRANAFTKYGYDFAGWKYGDQTFTDGQIVRNLIEQGTITLEAQWTPTEYEIHYDGITDEERFALNNPTTYTIETPAFQLRNPADRKDDDGDTVQVFVGWQETTTYPIIVLPNTNNLGTKTYKAIWESYPFPRYAITYNLGGGNVATANPTTHDKTESFTLNEPTKTGYTFTGWTGTTIEGDTPVMNYTLPAPHIRDAIEFTAHYRKNTYTINFDGNGSTSGSTASMNMNYDEAANLIANSFERTGYTFAGWKYNNEDYTDGAEVTNLTAEDGGVVTMVAQWEPTQYTIIFHANNENVENPDAMAAQIVTYDIETPLTANAYTWWQHKIVEWTTNENGTGTKYADKAVIKNLDANGGEIHLYAKWREIDAALDGRGNMTNKGINTKLKAITTANPDAKNFLHYPNGEPSDEIKASATDLSGTIDPIYAWVDGENIYWWSEDVKPRISTNNSVEYHYYGVGKSTAEGNVNNLEYMDLTGFDTTGIVGSRSPFEYTNIRRVDISDWDLSNATDMSYFAYHSNLEDIIFPEHFDIQKVTSLNMAFAGAKLKKLDFRGWKTRDLKYLTNFIQSMPTITEVTFGGDFNTDNVTSMSGMINANANLATINNINTLNTANVTSMRSMFDGDAAITSLDLSAFDTTALTDMAGMFKNMSGLTSLTLKGSFTAANVTNMEGTFYGVKNINTIDLSNLVSKPTNLKQTFAFTGGGAIETIDISNMDLSDVTTIEWTFFNANSGLKTIYTSSSVNPEVATNNTATFQYDTGLVGGANTHTYDVGGISSGVGSRIDDPDNGEPGYFTYKNARYIRYNGNGADNATPYGAMKSEYLKAGDKLTKNAFVRDGYVFTGWKDADNNEYTDELVMADLAESKTPLELYAQWKVPVVDFIPADELRLKMTSLATNDNNIKQFIPYPGTPDLDNISYEIVSTSESDFPIYMWYDSNSNTLYYWCEWERPRMSGVLTNLFSTTSNIENVDFSAIDLSGVTSTAQLFSQKTKLKSVDFGNWDASNVTDMYRMFYYASSLETVDLSNFNTTNLQGSLEGMFDHCESLKSIDFGDTFKTDNVTNMHTMFQNNTSLEELDLSSFNTSNVETMYYMFASDAALASINFGNNFNTANVTNMGWMFFGCNSLNMLDLSTFSSDSLTIATAMFRFAPLQTIYATGSFNLDGIDETTAGGQMTFANTNLIGGMGTSFAATDHKGAAYGRIDDPDNGTPGYFTIKGARYIRYHDNDGDDTNNEANSALMTSHYLTNTGSLKVNAFTNGSKTFIGWNTAADGSGDPYTDGQAMTELTESKTPLELYAQWEQTVQLVTFDDAYSAAGKTKVDNYYTMQDMDSSICNAVTTPVNTDNSDAMTTQLLDTRNNKVYDVGKLVDGRCWLLDNLSLDLTDVDVQDNLTEDTTNASNTTLGYLKNGGGGGADQYAMSGATIWTTSYNYSIPYIITAYSDTTGSGGYEAGKYGIYYTYCAATAGSYCYGGSPNYYNYGNASGDATEDICPKGWRLPTGGNSGETNTVSLAYDSDRTSVMNALHTPFSGDAVYGYDVSSGQQKINLYQGTAGHFWSSTFGDSTYMRSFAISETELIPSSSHYRTNATSVRCIAK